MTAHSLFKVRKNANFQNGSTFCRKVVPEKNFRHMLAYTKSFNLRIKHHDPRRMLCPGGSFLSLGRSFSSATGSRIFLVITIGFYALELVKNNPPNPASKYNNMDFFAKNYFSLYGNFHF